jgi:hypothetical protein
MVISYWCLLHIAKNSNLTKTNKEDATLRNNFEIKQLVFLVENLLFAHKIERLINDK